MSPEALEKIRKAHLGKHHSEETKRKISLSHLGKKHSKKSRKKMSLVHLGKPSFRKGKKLPESHRLKLAIRNKNNPLKDEKHPNWKGNNVGYSALHSWIYRKLGLAKNFVCVLKDNSCLGRNHWSNISGKYLRNINDWRVLCQSHHFRIDKVNHK